MQKGIIPLVVFGLACILYAAYSWLYSVELSPLILVEIGLFLLLSAFLLWFSARGKK